MTMTTITLEVPDEMASRITPNSSRWLDFLASGPSHRQLVQFKVSPALQAHLEELLDKIVKATYRLLNPQN